MNAKVLLVEDEKILAKLLAAYLAEEGVHTVNVTTAAEARDVLKTEGFDIAIIDISLPDESGDSLIPQLAAIKYGLKFIITTGDTSYSPPESLAHFGVTDDSVMYKPFSASSIMKKIKSILT